jgi:DNA-binding XRE family transcriptional regulator
MDTKTLTFLTTDDWLAANPLLVWRNNASQALPNPVDIENIKPPMPQEDVAESIGTSRMAVSLWENGKFMPKFQNIIELAKLMEYEGGATALYDDWQAWLNAKPADVQPVAV